MRFLVLRTDGLDGREVWLRLLALLVGGLTFQLAADIIETAISTTWESLARIAIIAVIRTFLNYFLEKDVGRLDGRTAADGGVVMNSKSLSRVVVGAALCSVAGLASAQTDPLPSWNDGAVKKSIVEFVSRVTTEGGAEFRAAGATHRHFRQRRHALDRKAVLFSGFLRRRPRQGDGPAAPGMEEDGAVQGVARGTYEGAGRLG